MNIEKYLYLNIRKIGIIFAFFIIALLIHNAFYYLFRFEEGFFLLLAAFVIPAYFLICVFYTIFHHVKRKLKKK
ncbi:hypothetical protein KY342_05960 [Candidatus Woesearchaeota archaeon]|nr:hypothetical protein [Candidatus Woesearchaeota archaeon]